MVLKKIFHKYWPLILAVVFFLAVTLPALFQKSHVMRNLEPYPDAILYLSRANNLAISGNFSANYASSKLKVPIPPLYSIYLAPFFLLSQNPSVFYLANILLGLTSLVFLYLIISKFAKSKIKILLLLLLFLSHGFILWLSGLALIENLGLTLLLVSLYVVFNKRLQMPVWLSVLLTSSWIFAKLNYLPFSALLFIIFSFNFLKQKEWSKLLKYIAGILLLATAYIGYEAWTGEGHLGFFNNLLASKVSNPEASGGVAFFSLKYFLPNIKEYFYLLLGKSKQLLWVKQPLSNPILIIFSGMGLAFSYINSKKKKNSLVLLAFFLAQFPILLVFTTVDARYVLLSIPTFIIGLAFLAKQKYFYSLIILVFISQIFFQKSLYKQIIAENILGRSQAWQQEAVLNFNSVPEQNFYMITALPAFFVDFYQNNNYQALPLSENQEFINKNKWTWKREYKTDNLNDLYDKLLDQNKQLFISNSYITHNHLVTKDYQKLQADYNFELIQVGCNKACNIYEISKK